MKAEVGTGWGALHTEGTLVAQLEAKRVQSGVSQSTQWKGRPGEAAGTEVGGAAGALGSAEPARRVPARDSQGAAPGAPWACRVSWCLGAG